MRETGNKPKLLYLGYAFPPGVANLFPEAQPAGHVIETSLITAVQPWFEIRSVGLSWIDVDRLETRDNSPGLPNILNLLDKKPELLNQLRSLRRLKQAFVAWERSGWTPDLIMVCNALCPVYNGFMRWLKGRPAAPFSILYLADSMLLQQKLSWTKRMRYRLKPLKWTDSEMVPFFDACVAVSRSTREFFAERKVPWLWLPNGCDPKRAIREGGETPQGPIQIGYFGTLALHGGIPQLLKIFTARPREAVINICGYGKARQTLAAQYAAFPDIRFHEPRTPDECVRFARGCDLMINARPIVPGNQNNFSSKVFEYALSGRAILTSCLSGVEEILGEDAFYFDAENFETSLAETLDRVIAIPRPELHRRGQALQDRMLREFSWEKQGERLASFLTRFAPADGPVIA